MSLFDNTYLLWLTLAVTCCVFTLLLFGYRKHLLESTTQYSLKPFRQDIQILYLICIIALSFGLSTRLGYQFYDVYKNVASAFSTKPSAMTVLPQIYTKDLEKQKAEKNNQSNKKNESYLISFTPPSPLKEQNNSSDDINLIMTVLGVFIALITGITVTIARYSVEDVKLASKKQTELHKERLAELDNRYKDKEIMSLLIQSKIAVIANMANAENYDNLIGVASGSILNAKLNLLNETSHFRETNFSVYKFSECLERLEMVMGNPAYQGVLPKFFSHDDLDAFESLLSFLRTPVDGAAQYKYDQAAKALEPFVHRLGKIVV